ncbi:MAG: CBS domain-containing protein [Burkholderiales bacterium]|nr:CBS domain-containing protein [Burkholderiales bacterium]
MLSQPVRSIIGQHGFVTAPPSATVRQAAELMARRHVGAVVVVEDDHLVGIFSERDAVFRVVARGLEPATTPLAQVMTPAPVTIGPERSFGHAMAVMQQHHCRHLPVVEDGRPIGIVSARNALDPALEDFVCEERRRRSFEAG